MQEPTKAMLEAARDWSIKKYGKPIGDEAARGCWQAMLAASRPPCKHTHGNAPFSKPIEANE